LYFGRQKYENHENKSAVTKFANKNNIDFAWQTRFYDHIIHTQNEIYIENNPAKWVMDLL
jgi:hypothetical protein